MELKTAKLTVYTPYKLLKPVFYMFDIEEYDQNVDNFILLKITK
jgi:hypothetical protein